MDKSSSPGYRYSETLNANQIPDLRGDLPDTPLVYRDSNPQESRYINSYINLSCMIF